MIVGRWGLVELGENLVMPVAMLGAQGVELHGSGGRAKSPHLAKKKIGCPLFHLGTSVAVLKV